MTGTSLVTSSGHLRPKCFRVDIKRSGEMCDVGTSRLVPCEAGTFGGFGENLQLLLVLRHAGGK